MTHVAVASFRLKFAGSLGGATALFTRQDVRPPFRVFAQESGFAQSDRSVDHANAKHTLTSLSVGTENCRRLPKDTLFFVLEHVYLGHKTPASEIRVRARNPGFVFELGKLGKPLAKRGSLHARLATHWTPLDLGPAFSAHDMSVGAVEYAVVRLDHEAHGTLYQV